MNDVKHEDYPFDKDLDEDLEIFLGNYGIDLWEIWSEVINESFEQVENEKMAKKNISNTHIALEVKVFQLERELEEQRKKYECDIAMLKKQHEKDLKLMYNGKI